MKNKFVSTLIGSIISAFLSYAIVFVFSEQGRVFFITHFLPISIVFLIVFVSWYLISKSDYMAKLDELDEYFHIIECPTIENKPIMAFVREYFKGFEISLKNTWDKDIDYIKGRVVLYRDIYINRQIDIIEIPFERTNFAKDSNEIRLCNPEAIKKEPWNGFYIHIDILLSDEQEIFDKRLHSEHFQKTYFKLLNSKKINIFGRIYDITWLYGKWINKVMYIYYGAKYYRGLILKFLFVLIIICGIMLLCLPILMGKLGMELPRL